MRLQFISHSIYTFIHIFIMQLFSHNSNLTNVRSNTSIDTLFVHILLLCNNIVFGV